MHHVFLSPHFDDAIGSCGGILWRLAQRGGSATVATVFAGPAPAQLSPLAASLHAEWNLEDTAGARRAEDAAACAVLGCSQTVLDYPEAIYRADPDGEHLYRDIRSLFGDLAEADSGLSEAVAASLAELCGAPDTLVHCPTADGHHVDHTVVWRAGKSLEAQGIPVIFHRSFYYDADKDAESNQGLTEMAADLSDEEAERKLMAFSMYKSQVGALFVSPAAMETAFDTTGRRETYLLGPAIPEDAASEISAILAAPAEDEETVEEAKEVKTDEPAASVEPVEERVVPQNHFERQFQRQEDPWNYASDYEQTKYTHTLSLIPVGPIKRGLEIGCAEGHFTLQLAPFVSELVACDVSTTALDRAAKRCEAFPDIDFRYLDIVEDPIEGPFDLIVCSETLYYIPQDRLRDVAAKIVDALAPGGHLLTAHPNVVYDDRVNTGFEWWDSHGFGSRTILETFAALGVLEPVRMVRTPLYSVALLKRKAADEPSAGAPEVIDAPLVDLPPKVAQDVVWDGAIVTRQEAKDREKTGVVPVLMYHSITDKGPDGYAPYRVSPAAFEEQLRALGRNGFRPLSLGAWAKAVHEGTKLRGRPVVITFDDGYLDFMDHALPILVDHGFSATVFVVTDRVGGTSEWDADVLPPQPLMGWDDLRTCLDNGISIDSHGASHEDMLTLSDDEIRDEGMRSRQALSEHLKLKSPLFSYPWGRNDERVRKVIADCGYAAAVSTSNGIGAFGGPSTLGDSPMALQRIEIAGTDTIHDFLRKLWIGGPRLRHDLEAANTEITLRKPSAYPWSRVSEQRDRILPEARTQGELWMPSDLDLRLEMSARLDALIGQFVTMQSELLKSLGPPYPLQKRIATLFAGPLRNVDGKKPRRYTEVCPGVRFGFDESGDVEVDVLPKTDLSASPDHCLNSLHIRSKEPGNWFAIEISVDWVEINQAKSYQIGLYGRPTEQRRCNATLRLRLADGKFHDIPLGYLSLEPDGRSAHVSGALKLPDPSDAEAQLDLSSRPILILYFKHDAEELDLALDYIAAYFA